MTITRFKIMAGILGVSFGGLAALAGQCPRPDAPHRSPADPPGEQKVPQAGAKSVPAIPAVPPAPLDIPPPTPTGPAAVELPALPTPSTPPTKLPALPPMPPAKVELPTPPGVPTPVVIPASGSSLPDVPPALPGTPTALPTAPTLPATTPTPPAPIKAVEPTPAPAITPALPRAAEPTPPAAPTPTPIVEPAPARVAPTVPAQQPAPQAAAAASRYRILLRVGEGEPTFEVKHGDDLVLRVVCEKVDVKSPERGSGPSSVVATGRVRFVGFGAEGTCESLSFLSGTGEVTMTGGVRVQVKDKLGRVESELTSDRLQYRIDAAHLQGMARP
jgi:hypothetical protein